MTIKPYYIGDVDIVSRDSIGTLSEISILDRHGEAVVYIQTYVQPRATEFVKCVNEYDGLKQQITSLKQLISKLNPYSTTGRCLVCKCERVYEHEDNCEYFKNMEENT